MMSQKPNYSRGNVVLVLYPDSNLKTAKARPALVIQSDDLDTGLPQIIVAMITSRLFRADHPSRVFISISGEEGQKSGLLSDSVVMTDNIATISDNAVYRVIGTFPMAKIDQALRHTLGI